MASKSDVIRRNSSVNVHGLLNDLHLVLEHLDGKETKNEEFKKEVHILNEKDFNFIIPFFESHASKIEQLKIECKSQKMFLRQYRK